jgi:hypothetical protein
VSESSLPAGLADLPRPELAAGWWPWAEDNTRLREVNARLREVVEAQAVQLEVLKGQQQALSRRVEELERKQGRTPRIRGSRRRVIRCGARSPPGRRAPAVRCGSGALARRASSPVPDRRR